MAERSRSYLSTLYLIAAGAGLVGVLLRVFLPTGTQSIVGILMDVVYAALAALAGVYAAKNLDRAALRASLVGVSFGVVAGLGLLLLPPSAAQIQQTILKQFPSMSPALVHQAVMQQTSFGMRLLGAVFAVVGAWLIALFIGWVASLFVKKPDQAKTV